jgi:hypothetical protein
MMENILPDVLPICSQERNLIGFRHRVVKCLVLALAFTMLHGCGYTVGPAFDGEVQSVYVEIFSTNTFRRTLEIQLTEAIQRQVQTESPLILAKEHNADTKLTGRIVGAKKRALGQTGFDDARQIEADIRIQVSWEDLRTGELLKQQDVDLPTDMINLKTEGVFAPEVGQSLATAHQIAIEKMAREIVQMMEAPW